MVLSVEERLGNADTDLKTKLPKVIDSSLRWYEEAHLQFTYQRRLGIEGC